MTLAVDMRNPAPEPTSCYATESFIRTQRIMGIWQICLGLLSIFLLPFVGAVIIFVAVPLVVSGSIFIGASLLQQAIGNSPGCQEGKAKRAIAGLCFLLPTPVTWLIGAIFWHCSNRDNQK